MLATLEILYELSAMIIIEILYYAAEVSAIDMPFLGLWLDYGYTYYVTRTFDSIH